MKLLIISSTLTLVWSLVFLFAISPTEARAFEQSATEILNLSKAAMRNPLRFRLIANGVDATVIQKEMPDGTAASFTEVTRPIRRITIVRGFDSFDILQEKGIAVNTRLLKQESQNQAQSINDILNGPNEISSRIVKTFLSDGVPCVEIESVNSQQALAAIQERMKLGRNQLPAVTRYVIEEKTYFVRKLEIIAEDGTVLMKSAMLEYQPQPDLTDDLFVIPPGLQIKTPGTMEEYLNIMLEVLNPDPGMPLIAQRAAPQAVIPPLPAAAPRMASDLASLSKLEKPRSGLSVKDQGPRRVSWSSWTLILANMVAIGAGMMFAICRWAGVFRRSRESMPHR